MQVQIQLQYMKYKLGQSILYIMGGSKTIVQSWWGFLARGPMVWGKGWTELEKAAVRWPQLTTHNSM